MIFKPSSSLNNLPIIYISNSLIQLTNEKPKSRRPLPLRTNLYSSHLHDSLDFHNSCSNYLWT